MADASLVFKILADDQATGTFKKFASGVTAAMAAATAAAGALALSAIRAASDMGETQSKVSVIFGQSAGKIEEFAATADKAFGLSKQSALNAAATFATFGKGAGLTGDSLAGFSTDLVKLSADLASFSNTSPEQAIEAIGSALRGESEPIRAYGILLDDATLRNEALALGLIKTTKEALTPQQKVLSAQAAIMKQTQDAQGDFGRTSGGLAAQQKILTAEFANAKVELGQQLLPYMLQFVSALREVLPWIEKHKDVLIPLVAGLYAVSVAIGIVNAVMALNPAGLIVIGIIALIAIFVALWMKCDGFREFWINLWEAIKISALAVWDFLKITFEAIKIAIGAVVIAFNVVVDVLKVVWDVWKTVFDFILNIVTSLINLWLHFAKGVFGPVAEVLISHVKAIGGAVMWLYDHGVKPQLDAIGAAFNWVTNTIVKPIFGVWWDMVQRVGQAFSDVFGNIGSVVGDAFKIAVSVAKGWINSLITMINGAVGLINRNVIDNANKVPGVNLPHIPSIPELALGGTVGRGGVFDVGEAGRERIFLPGGTVAQPLGRGGRSDGGGSSVTNNYTIMVPPTVNLAEVGKQVVEAIQEYETRNTDGWRTS